MPISEDELEGIKVDQTPIEIEYKVGDTVAITRGAFKDSIAKVLDTNAIKKVITVGVDFMGGERKLEISYYDVKKA